MCDNKKFMEIDNKSFDIDECMIPLVRALNDAGIETEGCCCGHGKTTGWIHLADDTYLIIATNRAKFITHKYAIWELIKE